ncbi:hypothetical protein EG68_10916 [Paragonimus skrjabini miyazakii]|uniref:Uncharacterized protein n=1 Tax=Paragonimus skrjabini miyazakii TaxID=59628 RepID=A0A8S9YFC6_9TREM|nr:hypothetical protein EG68_10916 [Paragonimus skrjabini miyazakii]
MHCFVYALLIVSLVQTECSVRLGFFSVPNLGKETVDNPTFMDTIAKICERYDLINLHVKGDMLFKEFRKFLKPVRKGRIRKFVYILSEPRGRSSMKGQDILIFKGEAFVVEDFKNFPDPNGHFERTPVHFLLFGRLRYSRKFPNFAVIAVQLNSNNVRAEMDWLYEEVEAYRKHTGMENVLIVGDMNLDCSPEFLKDGDSFKFQKDPSYYWLIPNNRERDSPKNACAYNRMIGYGAALSRAIGFNKTTAYRFDEDLHLTTEQAKSVSEYYPIEFTFEFSL